MILVSAINDAPSRFRNPKFGQATLQLFYCAPAWVAINARPHDKRLEGLADYIPRIRAINAAQLADPRHYRLRQSAQAIGTHRWREKAPRERP